MGRTRLFSCCGRFEPWLSWRLITAELSALWTLQLRRDFQVSFHVIWGHPLLCPLHKHTDTQTQRHRDTHTWSSHPQGRRKETHQRKCKGLMWDCWVTLERERIRLRGPARPLLWRWVYLPRWRCLVSVSRVPFVSETPGPGRRREPQNAAVEILIPLLYRGMPFTHLWLAKRYCAQWFMAL